VSERTLYILFNYAQQDVRFRTRYSTLRTDHGYEPVAEGDELYPIWLNVVQQFQVEVEDMTCDLVAALGEIRDAIEALTLAQSAGSGAVCCYEPNSDTWHPPDPGSGDPVNKCLLSYAFALYWEAGANEMYHQYALSGFPAMGALAAIFDELDVPGQALLELVTLGATHALPMLESLWRVATSNLVWDITCAIYSSLGAAEALAAVYAAIDSVEGLEGVAKQLMELPISYGGLNKIFDGTFPTEGIETPDCGDCGEPVAGDLFLTREVEPYDQLIIGDSITFDASNTSQGYRGQNSGEEIKLYFTPVGNAATWEWRAEISAPYYPGETGHYVAQVYTWEDEAWVLLQEFGPLEFDCDEWTEVYFLAEEAPLYNGQPYLIKLTIQDFNWYIFYRKIAGGTVT
jgi:hypothetical protein